MIPRKAKYFVKPVAEKLNVTEELVDDLLSFYWKEVRSTITKETQPLIYVKNLCTFKVRPFVLEKLIAEKEGQLTALDEKLFGNFAKVKIIQERLLRLKELHEKVKNISELRTKHQEKRNAKTTENTISDSGGIEEQDLQED